MPELVFRTRECAQHGHPEFTLRFREPRHDMPDPFSGWHLFCADKQHDHDSDGNVLATELLHLAARFPFVTQFLALPVETVVGIEGPGRIRARVMIAGEIVTPLDGSYLAALNDPKTLR